jgi:hypothetical protein
VTDERESVASPGDDQTDSTVLLPTDVAGDRPQLAVWRTVLAAAVVATILLCSGWIYLKWIDLPSPGGETEGEWMAGVGVASLVFVAVLGGWLWIRIGRRLLFDLVLLGMLSLTSLVLLEAIARLKTPAWPLRDLHGTEAVFQMVDAGASVPRNSWGQVDRERTVRPAAGVRRVALVGDSFLDEVQGESLAVRVEAQVGRPDVEVINLGVSATGPDEYCYRIERVALRLGAKLCVVCVYLGNDLSADARTLTSRAGLVAVSPRGAVLSDLGGHGLNHVLTNELRPVIQAWRGGAGLAAEEAALHGRIRKASDAQLAGWLMERLSRELAAQGLALPPDGARRLQARLTSDSISEFFAMLRAPDAGKFRSYFLDDALVIAAYDQVPRLIFHDEYVLHWLRQSRQVCQRAGADLAVVLIPEGFAVDPRMRAAWEPLAEMRRLTEDSARHAVDIERTLRSEGMAVLNLRTALQDVPGTYLNVEGHWSDQGGAVAAEAIGTLIADWAAGAAQ